MHIKLLQKNDRLIVDSMARDTAQTKRAVDGVLDLVHASADEIERSRRLPDAVVAALRDTGINRLVMASHRLASSGNSRLSLVEGATTWICAEDHRAA
jgi:hypothetical protein